MNFTLLFENRVRALINLFLLVLVLIVLESKFLFAATTSPSRIVSLTVGSDEILYDILESANKLSNIAALSTYADNKTYSNIYAKAKNIQHRTGSQIESVLKLKPDLIIVAAYTSPDLLEKLKSLKLPVLRLKNFASIEDIKENILSIGRAIGHLGEAKVFAKKLDRIRKLPISANYSGINYHPSGMIMGSGTIIDDLMTKMGTTNVVTQKGWPKVSSESILRSDPDFIIVGGEPSEKAKILKNLKDRFGWKDLAAVKKERVMIVPKSSLSATSHYILEAYDSLAAQLVNLKI